MKKMKRLVALALSVVMVLAMSVFAFAAEGNGTYKITAPATDHQYEIYQIFTGDLSNGTLSNVKWGQNGTGTTGEAVVQATLDALTAINTTGKSNKEKLEVITQYATLSNPVATITDGATYNAEAGYYLIKDVDNSLIGKEDAAYTTYIVEVVGDVTIEPKADVPSFEKKLKDTNDTTETTSGWQDSADYDIGDTIPFKLTGKVASNYADYKGKYYFAFHDTEEKGLTFDASSVKVYVDNGSDESTDPIAEDYYEVVTEKATEEKTDGIKDNCTFEVIFKDLKKVPGVQAGSKIRVEYSSTLNESANIGNQGNVNTGKLEFSNNPNEEQKGDEKPGTGETPEDSVIVFTYKVVVNKYKDKVAAGNKLTGAEFTLEKVLKDGSKKTITVVKTENGTQFTFSGLDDGDYILTETVTPEGYNTIDPITFTVTASHDVEWTTKDRKDVLTSLSGETASGKITFTASENNSGELVTNVVNKKGSTLPSTGGIGTTIFYVVGGILMIGAAVLLITKRRAEN